ncbi:CDP-glycerol glycerophosphotransferase, TagB/SpsB family [Loktanella sp. DSM 29012]|uniref:bifunctional glycosyltransferase/CDP-glycerol:glycerophosphate glycerophosphotransferase n=1 Tax=Loktanella sp. DSM 29012 TaxID=1881056 RepID=UPI0008BCE6D9|nr:CDP-glycerol glycerophosphotransferase family protein [Loktanella sp. DSM 29012]SEQ76664.1 CDP-glycerol glycerophosphotransferase, TagB/SpsB family [Loktanella sp. DSM 29012]
MTFARRIKTLIKRVRDDVNRPGRQTTVSVIVPVYNVEAFLPACLDSILAQTHRKLEIICVDDGSPDDSITVLQRYAARDKRIKIVRKANGGLGAARNTGVEHATGEMLCFVDSDDTIPPQAIAKMLGSLVHSGSDFVVGSLMRDTPTGRYVPPWAQRLHRHSRTGCRLADEPEVLKNVFAWTKLYRRAFFERVVGGFPTGLYEDQLPSLKAYKAGTFDILSDVVCHWRIRDDGTSITQQKASLDDLNGRWRVIADLTAAVADEPDAIKRPLLVKIIGFDMRPYYEQVPRTEDAYWNTLHAEVRDFIDTFGYDLLRAVSVSDRLIAAAAYHGHRADISTLLQRRERQTWQVPGTVINGTARICDVYFDGLDLRPDGVVECLNPGVNIDVSQYIDTVTIDAKTLIVRGTAFLKNLSQTAANSTITLHAHQVSGDGPDRVVQSDRLDRFDAPEADVRANDPWNDHAASGFEAHFDLTALAAGHWNLQVSVTVDGVTCTVPLAADDQTAQGRLASFAEASTQGRWSIMQTARNAGLQLRYDPLPGPAVQDAWATKDTLCLKLANDVQPGTRFRATARLGRVTGRVTQEADGAVVTFNIPPRSGILRDWQFWAVTGRLRKPLVWGRAERRIRTDRMRPYLYRAAPKGVICLQTAPLVAEITDVTLTDGGLQISGWRHGGGIVTARLFSQFVPGSGARLPSQDGDFTVTLPLTTKAGSPLSRTRGYAVVLVPQDGEKVWPQVSNDLGAGLPISQKHDGDSVTLTLTPRAQALWVQLGRAQGTVRALRTEYLLQQAYRADHVPRDAVLFEAFGGATIGDSPLALSHALHQRQPQTAQYWSVASPTISVPDWATPLLRFSPEWYDMLASARLLVNNNNWPWFFIKRPYQTYLQTWHGTPLKKIGHDAPTTSLSLSYRALMVNEAASWDYLIAQNDYAARIFPQAFGYAGEILQEGYPRNDALVNDAAHDLRQQTRDTLGLDDDTHVLLYAPTWRDNLKGPHGGYGRVFFLDMDLLQERTQAKTVVLYRGHSNTANAANWCPPGVVDVTHHPDVNALMLASDALITDYSSIFFDYAVMEKPIYFLVPDLDQYADATRGFYVPLADIAPGPLCADTAALVQAMNVDFNATYGDRRDTLRADYAPKDDGRAAARVLDILDQRPKTGHPR